MAGWQASLSWVRARLPWMSAVMSSWGNSPGTRPLTWIPYGAHSTARVSVRFFTPALAAAECAKPGPPVHAYDAPTLMIEPGSPAARWRRANSLLHRNVPFRVMSTTVRQALGDMSSAGTGKLAAALFTRTPGRPNVSVATSKALAIESASRMSHAVVTTGAPNSFMASSPASRWSALRLAMTIEAPSLANSEAMALPRPVPPPVTNTHAPANVPASSAVSPAGGGWGRPGSSGMPSTPSVGGRSVLGLGGAHLGEVLALVDECLVDELVAHRRLLQRTGHAPDHPPGHLHGDRWRGRDLVGHLACHRVELVTRHHAGDDAVVQRLLGRHAPGGQHHVAHQTRPHHLVQHADAARVGDHAVADLGQHELGVVGGDADVAQQRPLEGAADGPPLDGDDDRRLDVPHLLNAAVAAAHQFVVGQVRLLDADRADVPP